MYKNINAISWCLDLNFFQQDEYFCSKLGLEVEYAKSNLKTSLFKIWVICDLLPFVRVNGRLVPHSINTNTLVPFWLSTGKVWTSFWLSYIPYTLVHNILLNLSAEATFLYWLFFNIYTLLCKLANSLECESECKFWHIFTRHPSPIIPERPTLSSHIHPKAMWILMNTSHFFFP